MARTITRRKAPSLKEQIETFRQHLVLKDEAKTITSRSEALKKRLKEWLPVASEAYEDERGSRFVDLDETVEVNGQPYKGMELRRSVSVQFDEDVAEAILKRKKVYEEALSTYVDQDKVRALHQTGALTDGDLDKMFVEKESFSFWPVKGEVY